MFCTIMTAAASDTHNITQHINEIMFFECVSFGMKIVTDGCVIECYGCREQ